MGQYEFAQLIKLLRHWEEKLFPSIATQAGLHPGTPGYRTSGLGGVRTWAPKKAVTAHDGKGGDAAQNSSTLTTRPRR